MTADNSEKGWTLLSRASDLWSAVGILGTALSLLSGFGIAAWAYVKDLAAPAIASLGLFAAASMAGLVAAFYAIKVARHGRRQITSQEASHKPSVSTTARVTTKVVALKAGYYGEQYRKPGDVFEIDSAAGQQLPTWVRVADRDDEEIAAETAHINEQWRIARSVYETADANHAAEMERARQRESELGEKLKRCEEDRAALGKERTSIEIRASELELRIRELSWMIQYRGRHLPALPDLYGPDALSVRDRIEELMPAVRAAYNAEWGLLDNLLKEMRSTGECESYLSVLLEEDTLQAVHEALRMLEIDIARQQDARARLIGFYGSYQIARAWTLSVMRLLGWPSQFDSAYHAWKAANDHFESDLRKALQRTTFKAVKEHFDGLKVTTIPGLAEERAKFLRHGQAE